MYNRSLFPYRLRMRVSCPEAGVNVPTFSRFRIFFTLVLSPRGVTDAQAPCEGIPLGKHARPHYYCTQLAKMRVSSKWISQLPCLILLNILTRSRRPHEPQAGHRVGPPRARSTQADTIAEETNKTVRLVSIKGPRSAKSTRSPSPATRRLWLSHKYLVHFGGDTRGTRKKTNKIDASLFKLSPRQWVY